MNQYLRMIILGLAVAGCSEPRAPAHPGQEVYTRYCFSCHAAGVAGAPRVGVAEDWGPRIAKGRPALLESTINGVPPGMPARGLCMECSDDQLRDAIGFMIEASTPPK